MAKTVHNEMTRHCTRSLSELLIVNFKLVRGGGYGFSQIFKILQISFLVYKTANSGLFLFGIDLRFEFSRIKNNRLVSI